MMINYFPDNCTTCREKIDKGEYYDCRRHRTEDAYTVCGMCREKPRCSAIFFDLLLYKMRIEEGLKDQYFRTKR